MRTIDTIPVKLAGFNARYENVPYMFRALTQGNPDIFVPRVGIKKHNSTLVAFSLNSAKLVPASCKVAANGYGAPSTDDRSSLNRSENEVLEIVSLFSSFNAVPFRHRNRENLLWDVALGRSELMTLHSWSVTMRCSSLFDLDGFRAVLARAGRRDSLASQRSFEASCLSSSFECRYREF